MLNDLRQIYPWRNMPRSLYYPYMHRRLEHTFTRAVVRIAYPEAWQDGERTFSGNTDHILGFIIADPSQDTSVGLILHYLYTRRDYSQHGGAILGCYRKQGIAKKLLEGMMHDYNVDHVTFTIWGQELVKSDSLLDKLRGEWKHKMTYNCELFNTLLPFQWERGLKAHQHKTEDMAQAYADARKDIPVDF